MILACGSFRQSGHAALTALAIHSVNRTAHTGHPVLMRSPDILSVADLLRSFANTAIAS